jgi:hypothetical protein
MLALKLLREYASPMEMAPNARDEEVIRAIRSEMGKKGGAERARRLTPAQRKRIARRAARIRWAKKKTA